MATYFLHIHMLEPLPHQPLPDPTTPSLTPPHLSCYLELKPYWHHPLLIVMVSPSLFVSST